MPDLDPQQLANDVLDQARMIRLVRDANQQLAGENAQLRDGWNTLALVKARYDELKAEADGVEAREVAAAMTSEKPVASTNEPAPAPINRVASGVESAQPGSTAGKRGERGGRRR